MHIMWTIESTIQFTCEFVESNIVLVYITELHRSLEYRGSSLDISSQKISPKTKTNWDQIPNTD